MTTARDIMSSNTECAQVSENLVEATKKRRDLGVGAMPICGEDDRLKGMITDRDIVVKFLADGGDPTSTTVESSWRTRSFRPAGRSVCAAPKWVLPWHRRSRVGLTQSTREPKQEPPGETAGSASVTAHAALRRLRSPDHAQGAYARLHDA
jgi:hypothetical protein